MRNFLAMIATSVVLSVITGSAFTLARAQVVRPIRQVAIQPSGDKVMRVHAVGNGAGIQPDKSDSGPPPEKLTSAQKLSLAGAGTAQLSLTASFVLTPGRPFLLNRGMLLFQNAASVYPSPTNAIAAFASQTDYPGALPGLFNDRAVTVAIQDLMPGKHYMIDCAVKGGDEYFVRVVPGGMKQTFSNTNHVIVIVEAGDNYAEISVSGKATNHFWFFYSAEVTKLD